MREETKSDNLISFTQKAKANSAKRVHNCVKVGFYADQCTYDEVLAKMIDELGIDFVCEHACQNTLCGGKECAPDHCEEPDGYGFVDLEAGEEEMTCRETLRAYIEVYMGQRDSSFKRSPA